MPFGFDTILTCGLFIVLIFYLLKFSNRPRQNGSLPGPPGLPLIGHILSLTKQPWRKFLQWKMEYGPIFGISLAGKRIVIVSEPAASLEISLRPEVLGSPSLEYFEKLNFHRGGNGMSFIDGKDWQENRNFVLASFTDFGTRGQRYHNCIALESEKLISDLKKLRGAPVNLDSLFQQYAFNAVWQAIGNQNFTPENVNLALAALKATTVFDSALDYMGLLFPSIVEKVSSALEWRFETLRKWRSFLGTAVLQHSSTRIPGQPRDMIDKFQDKVDSTADPESTFHAGKQSIVPVLIDISNAAVDTSAITMQWLVVYALKYPNMHAKIKAEISKVIGQDREPAYPDQAEMPFTEAFILETLRTQPAGPYGIPRRALQDFFICGKLIPKDALVLLNLNGMNHDPSLWEEPELFKPERFLTPEGTISSDMRKKLCTFSVGKRQCPGERFARQALFLVFTNLVQNFDFITNDTACFDVTLGFLARPSKPMSVLFKPRT